MSLGIAYEVVNGLIGDNTVFIKKFNIIFYSTLFPKICIISNFTTMGFCIDKPLSSFQRTSGAIPKLRRA